MFWEILIFFRVLPKLENVEAKTEIKWTVMNPFYSEEEQNELLNGERYKDLTAVFKTFKVDKIQKKNTIAPKFEGIRESMGIKAIFSANNIKITKYYSISFPERVYATGISLSAPEIDLPYFEGLDVEVIASGPRGKVYLEMVVGGVGGRKRVALTSQKQMAGSRITFRGLYIPFLKFKEQILNGKKKYKKSEKFAQK